jgi:transcriptional regulator with XRE-family HTH domain
MEVFRNYLKQEYMRRSGKNPNYSLRAFAQQLGLNHATLSTMLSGKRRITESSTLKISKALGLSPKEIGQFVQPTSPKGKVKSAPYYFLQQDSFSLISEWYYDAILELSLIEGFKLEPKIISQSLNITPLQAKLALETLERLELLKRTSEGRYRIQHQNSTNILDEDFTTAAQKKHQRSILEKSLQALENVDRKNRDHTSMTIAINRKDLSRAKDLIRNFRYKLNSFLQRDNADLDEVYQLQVSFFPLSHISNNRSYRE